MPTSFNKWLKDLAAPSFKVVVGALLAAATALVYLAIELRCSLVTAPRPCRAMDSTSFALWLAFVASWGGTSYRQLVRTRAASVTRRPDG